MDPINEALELLKRQAELEVGLRQAGGIRVAEERELFAARAAPALSPGRHRDFANRRQSATTRRHAGCPGCAKLPMIAVAWPSTIILLRSPHER